VGGKPCVLGTNWKADRPHINIRYSWTDVEWEFVVRDLSINGLYRLNARNLETGQVFTFARDVWWSECSSVDALGPLFGAAFRMATNNNQPWDTWKKEPFPRLFDNVFFNLPQKY
jgi:hypothetical protein